MPKINLAKFSQIGLALVMIALGAAVTILWLSYADLRQTIAHSSFSTSTQSDSDDLDMPQPLVEDQTTNMGNQNSIELAAAEASIAALNKTIKQLTLDLQMLEQKIASAAANTSSSTNTEFQKETIYLGSASTTSRDWKETGLEVGINSAHYPPTVEAKIEVGMSIIGGEVWARLKNKSTGVIIPVSEISHNTSSTTWKTSPAFQLHEGGNTYVLEARSSSGEVANIAGARIILEKK